MTTSRPQKPFRKLSSRLSAPLLIVLGLLTSTAAYAQVSAQTQSVNFGSVNIGSSTNLTLNYSVESSEALGTPNVLTQGAPNLDFTLAGGSTCSNLSLLGGSSCTVNVTFSPKFAGPRNGAVEIVDASGNVLATTYVHGIGNGPQATLANITSGAYLPSAQSTLASGLVGTPAGLAVDGSGNVFVAEDYSSVVQEIVAADGSVKTLSNSFNSPLGVAVDGSGNVFVADSFHGAVKEIVAAGGYQTVNTLGSGFSRPEGVAVDGSGNVFVADGLGNAVKEIVAAGGYQTVNTLGGGFSTPSGVAVDANGNVFVRDYGNQAVKEILAAGGYTTVLTLATGVDYGVGLALDASNNVYFADEGGNAVKEIVAAGGYTTVLTLGSGFSGPLGIAVDGRGNVFAGDVMNTNRVQKLDYADAPTLTFAATNIGSTSSDSPQSVALRNIGNATLSAIAPGLSIGANFEQVAGSGTPPDCSAGFSLAPGASCNLSLSFKPTMSGPIQSSAILTDNALNANPATQTVPLNGTGNALTQTITFNPIPSQVQGAKVTLSASASSGLPVSFTSLTPSICTVSGTTATLVSPGTCTIQATQPGNAQYSAATPVTQSFSVTPAATFTITPIPPAEIVYREILGGVILKLQSVKGFNGNVTLSCSGGPAGTKCADLPGTIHLNGTAYAVSGVLFPNNTPDGTYVITFTGVSGSLTNSTTAKFTVK